MVTFVTVSGNHRERFMLKDDEDDALPFDPLSVAINRAALPTLSSASWFDKQQADLLNNFIYLNLSKMIH